jgi:Methyltransferase domain
MTTSALFRQIEDEVPRLQGWCSVGKAITLANLVLAYRPLIIYEIGIYGGASLIPMALACKHIKNGTVIGIDPYDAAESVKGETKVNADHWSKVDHKAIRDGFRKKIVELGLQSYVTFHEATSDAVEPKMHEILHVDGRHTDQAVRDVLRYGARVRIGGFMVMDDPSWPGGGVLRAIDTAKEMGFKEISRFLGEEKETGRKNDFCIMQKIR